MSESVIDLRPKSSDKPARSRRPKLLLIIALAAILVAAIGAAAFWYFRTRTATSADADLKSVETQVGRHYVLPTDETPVLATVADKSQVSAQFLKNSQDGDRILVYQKNRLAIVYRPSIDRIVAVGPVTYELPPVRSSAPAQP